VVPAHTSRIENASITITQYCGHNHRLTVTVDSGGVITETSESDNSMGINYSVANP
jgi:hypothetical protein